MKVVTQEHTILSIPDDLSLIEQAGRTCYQSKSKGTPSQFVQKIVHLGHESVLEHLSITVKLITDRAISHELVRHRLASYSERSTRYCRYDRHVRFIQPVYLAIDSDSYKCWQAAMSTAESAYLTMLAMGAKAEEARAVLPQSTETEIIVTANLREWRHILALRTSTRAHPQMRALMVDVQRDFQAKLPSIF